MKRALLAVVVFVAVGFAGQAHAQQYYQQPGASMQQQYRETRVQQTMRTEPARQAGQGQQQGYEDLSRYRNETVAPTPAVSLGSIPYTGFDFGVVGNMLYWLGLMAFASAGAYLVLWRVRWIS